MSNPPPVKWFKDLEGEKPITDAWKKLVKQWHPDICKRPDATITFQEIQAEYEYLKKLKFAKRGFGTYSTGSTQAGRTNTANQQNKWGGSMKDPEPDYNAAQEAARKAQRAQEAERNARQQSSADFRNSFFNFGKNFGDEFKYDFGQRFNNRSEGQTLWEELERQREEQRKKKEKEEEEENSDKRFAFWYNFFNGDKTRARAARNNEKEQADFGRQAHQKYEDQFKHNTHQEESKHKPHSETDGSFHTNYNEDVSNYEKAQMMGVYGRVVETQAFGEIKERGKRTFFILNSIVQYLISSNVALRLAHFVYIEEHILKEPKTKGLSGYWFSMYSGLTNL